MEGAGFHSVPAGLPASSSIPPRVVSGKEEDAMPTYRAYLIDGDDRVASYKPIDAETDAEALKAARQLVDGCDVEVWHLDRKIGRLGRDKK
jgi:hypothetical protein